MDTIKTTSQPLLHPLSAGLMPGDMTTELFGDRSKKGVVHFLTNGSVKAFKDIPLKIRQQIEAWLLEDFKTDTTVKEALGKLPWSQAVEQYAYCLFGSADKEADFCAQGKIQKPDNFRCGDSCKCLAWKRKNISYDEVNMTMRELEILDQLKTGLPDKMIAHNLGIALPTINNHKKNIMIKLGAQNKTEAVYKAGVKKILR